ncbi:Kinesin-related protein 11 [Halocaridina rubra]|uniref:Kinesin-like protein n=1 Tax=Halocaridina rubra TaxID=373956 RepID=A0AAN8WIQ0_HALRR
MASPTSTKKGGRKHPNSQNIKVFVRCRPQNTQEKLAKSFNCIDIQNSREIVVKERSFDKFTKTFTFDKVFGPDSKQIDVYKAVAKNSVEEVLNGFNCTIFAYGQTGTGKTYTMEGERTLDSTTWDDGPEAGIIPRCVNHLFDELRLQNIEFTMRVSFLELYNEELFDLLSPSNDMSKLRLYEDTTRKGSCIIHGLEEVLVRSKSNVYEILEKGSNKRQTAATLMNAHSSRSHTVFTITVHIRENVDDCDELLKIGKLHLVDLAGSENIGRSGAVDKRAREAGSINMSLLTLGRVITSLIEKAPHVPYRESKLTRLLQDALGGRTKTSIIATISPSSVNMEETLSTLEYAHRAKNIQNRPEVNQKLNKKELIGEYSQEIERLRLDLMAVREKSGVYLANENYQEMVKTLEIQAQEISVKINYIRSLEEGMEQKTSELNSASSMLDELSSQLKEMEEDLQRTKEVLSCTQKLLYKTSVDCDEQKYLVKAHVKTEDKLHAQGKALVQLAGTTTGDLSKLHAKLDRKKSVEESNSKVGEEFKDAYLRSIESMMTKINDTTVQQQDGLVKITKHLDSSRDECKDQVSSILAQWKDISQNHVACFRRLRDLHKVQVKEQLSCVSNYSKTAVGEFQNMKKQVKSFEQDFIFPAMENLALLITSEATMMASLHKTVSDKLADLNMKCESFVGEQSRLVETHKTQMFKFLDTCVADSSVCKESYSTFCSSLEVKLKTLDDKAAEMEAMMRSMHDLRESVCADIADAKSFVPETLRSLDEACKTSRKQMQLYCQEQGSSDKRFVSDVQSLILDSQNNVDDYANKIEQNVQRLGEARCGLNTILLQHVTEDDIFLNAVCCNVQDLKKNIEKTTEESITRHAEQVEEVIMKSDDDKKALLNMLESECARLDEDISALKDECHLNFTNLQKHLELQSEQLDAQKINVVDLFTRKIVHDVPTVWVNRLLHVGEHTPHLGKMTCGN